MKKLPPINNKYPIGTIIKHIKRGSIYEITGTCIIESTLEFAYNYKCVSDDNVWVRPIEEIEDINRFIVLPTILTTVLTNIDYVDVKKVTDVSGKVVGLVRSSNGYRTNIAVFDEEVIKKINKGTTQSYSMGSSYKGVNMNDNEGLFGRPFKGHYNVTSNRYKDQFDDYYHNVSERSTVVGAGEKYHKIKCSTKNGKCPICEAISNFENEPIIIASQVPKSEATKLELTREQKVDRFLHNLGDSDMVKAIRKSMNLPDTSKSNESSTITKGSENKITGTSITSDAFDVLQSKTVSDTPKTYDPNKVKVTYPMWKPVVKEPIKRAQLTTSFILTPDYIIKNVMPTLNTYGLHEVDAFSALFAKFRGDSDYKVELKVLDDKIFNMTPEIAVNLVVSLFDKGHLA